MKKLRIKKNRIIKDVLFRLLSLHLYFFTSLFLLLFYSCGQQSTPTTGTQKVYIDESYEQLFRAQVEMFHGIYKYSQLEDSYKPEGEIVQEFLDDSVRIVVLNRDLTENEREYFNKKKSFPVSTKIAVDALAFITHRDNPIEELTWFELRDIFTGKKQSWKDFDPSLKNKPEDKTQITLVFDNEKSSNVRLIKEKLLKEEKFAENVFAVKTNPEVIDYVNKNKNALGIIGVNWISDADDTLTRSFMNKINVLAVSSEEEPGDFFKPYQAYIYSREYPFLRDVYIINREGRTGLGTGFAAFVAGEKGQLIILKAGMVPATQPVRIVNVKMK